jgi:hypothetical protein
MGALTHNVRLFGQFLLKGPSDSEKYQLRRGCRKPSVPWLIRQLYRSLQGSLDVP